DGKFENRLGEHRATDAPAPAAVAPADAAKGAAANDDPASAPARTSKYDTRIPETPANASAPSPPAETPQSAVAQPAKAPEPRAAEAPAHAPAAHDGFAVQLAAFADDKGANALAGRLKKAGYAAYTEPLKTSKGTMWRVRVGPYPSRDAAVAARDKLKAEGEIGIVAAIK
ncbi:MAG TPA: SPOR domain-containing protein, partial [Casimicrobiaceae bacterium]|nr:SPOR domain-containing protein [Casimicrobiaceae bacterium]